MQFYKEDVRLSESIGNNALSYDERMALGSQGKLFLPSLIDGNTQDLILGYNIVFEEVENEHLISCIGPRHLLKIEHEDKTIYIAGNHNHALYFRYDALKNGRISQGATLLHVDQHADMNIPDTWIDAERESDMDYIAAYVNEHTQIASFIEPALHSGLLKESIQIRSEAKLAEMVEIYENNKTDNLILDIDIDFFAHEVDYVEKIRLLQRLIKRANIVTIATSPYFIDQQRAINITKQLLS